MWSQHSQAQPAQDTPASFPRQPFRAYFPQQPLPPPHLPILHPTHYSPPPPKRDSTDKRTLIENYDHASLAIDEIVDDGIILEMERVIMPSRVSRPLAQDAASVKDIDLSEQGLLSAWDFAQMKSVGRMRQGL